jgi:tryptophanyl-tRNA synthetase
MKAKTDAGPTEPNSTKPEEIENLFQLMRIMSSKDTLNHFENAYNDCSIRYGDLKKQLAEDIENFVSPLREKIKDLAQNEEYISKVVKLGADKARASANETLKLVREAIGIRKFY